MRFIILIGALTTLMVVLLPFHAAQGQAKGEVEAASGSTCPIHDKIVEMVVRFGGTDEPAHAMKDLGEKSKTVLSKEDMKKAMGMNASEAKACEKDFDDAYRKKLKDAGKSDEEIESFMKELQSMKKSAIPAKGGSGKPKPEE